MGEPAARPPYNVALFIVDDLRADRLGPWGGPRKTSPQLESRLSAPGGRTGTVFLRCQTPTGWTLPACASIATGYSSDEHGLWDHNGSFRRPKLGHRLGEHYRRVAITNNGNMVPNHVSKETLAGLGLKRKPDKWKHFDWEDGFDEYLWTPHEDHDRPFELARDFLAARRDVVEPYFLFFHTNLVHDYYLERGYYLDGSEWLGREIHPGLREYGDGPEIWRSPPPGLDWERMTEDLLAKYDAGARETDRRLGELLDLVDFETTIVVVMSDHGEGFEPELGRVNHCGRLHQDLLHVPLLLWLPEAAPGDEPMPRVERRLCSTLDVVPTILGCLGLELDDLPGVPLYDLPEHRTLTGVDRGYVYWGEDCVRQSYDFCDIELRSTLRYPLKTIVARRDEETRHFSYNLAYDPGEADNLLAQPGDGEALLEPVTFVVACSDREVLEANLLASPVAQSGRHQWIVVDNASGSWSSISALYEDAASRAECGLLFFLHQDVYLPDGWESKVARALGSLERKDPDWGVIGAVGALAERERASSRCSGHWCDPHGYHFIPPLPREVDSLDEMWLGVRREGRPAFDPNLPGFQCYGMDLSLTARAQGRASYAVDAFLWHKYRTGDGRAIERPEDSPSIESRWSDEFMASFLPSARYVEDKWRAQLPFRTTSWSWPSRPSSAARGASIGPSSGDPGGATR